MHTLINEYRTENCFVTLNGDFLGGSSLSERFKGENVIPILNHMNIDAVTLGNHEFDYGTEILKERMAASNFMWFGSNVVDSRSGRLFERVTDTHIVRCNSQPIVGPEATQLLAPLPLIREDSIADMSSPIADSIQSNWAGAHGAHGTHRAHGAHGAAHGGDVGGGSKGSVLSRGKSPRPPVQIDDDNDSEPSEKKSRTVPNENQNSLQGERKEQSQDSNMSGGSDDGSEEENDPNMVSIGMFGVCTERTPVLSWPGPTVAFGNYLESSRKCVQSLQDQGADVIIGVTHVSLREDVALAKTVPGIQVIIGGHDHTPHAATEGNTLIMKCGQNARWLGVVDLHIEVSVVQNLTTNTVLERRVRVIPNWRMIANYGIKPDPTLTMIIGKFKARKEKFESREDLDEVVSTVANHDLSTRTSTVRTTEASIGNLIADAMAAHYAADLAVINGGFIRGDRNYRVGLDITVGMIRKELPFSKNALKIRIQGKYVISALEQMLSMAPAQCGCYPHLSRAFSVRYSDVKPPLERIQSILINGKPIDPEAYFSVVISEFLARGGDGISAWTSGVMIEDHKLRVSDMVLDFLRNRFKGRGVSGKRRIRLVNVSDEEL